MQKRTMYSLLLISFMVAFAASLSFANTVTIQSKADIPRCTDQAINVDIDATVDLDAIEIVLEITEGPNGGFLTVNSVDLDASVTDLLGTFDVDLTQVDGVSPDYVRFYAMKLEPEDQTLPAGAYTAATINFTTSDNCGDDVTVDNGIFPYVIPGVTTLFIEATSNAVLPVAVTAGTVSIANQAPVITAIADQTIHWGDFFSISAGADDDDVANGCETLEYIKVSGPADLSVDIATGAITWQTTGADVCIHDVEVKVVDLCGAEDVTAFTICVENDAPELSCPEDLLFCFGETIQIAAPAIDPDGGPYPLVYSLVSFDGPGTVLIDPATGDIEWETTQDAEYTGEFELCITVTDSANVCEECSPRAADTCCISIEVAAMRITIETEMGSGPGVIQGTIQTVDIDMLGPDYNNYPIAGYNFLIAYDASALNFREALPGQFLEDCEWEYFTYRYGPDGNCDGACPSGLLRVVAIAETNNGASHPDCYTNTGPETDATQLAQLLFLVSNDRTLECQFVPIRFYWLECQDNGISTVTGDTLLISHRVYDMATGFPVPIADPSQSFPTYQGAPDDCDVFTEKGEPLRCADFWNGGIKIICADSIDAVGDVNLNGIAYEVADAVMFTNYFINGLDAFGDHVDGSVAATDANRDGIPLSVADLVYLIRVVVGDADPYPKEVASATSIDYSLDAGVIATQGEVDLGAAYLVIAGDVRPDLLANNMEMGYRFDGTNTHVLVFSIEGNGFSGEFLAGIDGDIVSLEMATVAGLPVVASNVPTNYSLNQNYPNPFNPTTTIEFATPSSGNYSLTIYNIQGQVVEEISGVADAPGVISVEWDASNNASGVYLYKLDVNEFSSVKKMVLLK